VNYVLDFHSPKYDPVIALLLVSERVLYAEGWVEEKYQLGYTALPKR
jgi:hypothetical protein